MKDKKEETEEKPKAVVEMEENSDEGKAKKRIKEQKEQDVKTANKKFIIKYIVFLVLIVLITGVAIYFSIKRLNIDVEESVASETIDISKPVAEDSKYAINSYSETYDENSLGIRYYAGNDQLVENTYGGEEYVQIEGMLDKDIQSRINTRLKETAKKLKEGNRRTYSQVTANFSNILSVIIYNEDFKREAINIDLSTGNDIPVENVFVSSTPLNSLIMEGVFKSLAWDKLSSDYEADFGTLDMNKVDTSEYEDIALKVVSNFKAKGKDIKFNITTTGINIYGITDKNMYSSNYENSSITIDFLEHREDVAIYKRYLTNKSIYENDSVGAKDIIVFTDNIYDDKYIYDLEYGQDDNVFMEEALIFFTEEASKDKSCFETIKEYLKNKANEDKQKIKSQTDKNTGTFYQKEINLNKQENYYCAYVTEYQATCDISYFKDEAFKDYAKMANGFRADIGMNGFTEYDRDEYPNLKISKYKTSNLYFDKNGKFIGTTEEEAKAKITQNEETSINESNNSENLNTSVNNINTNTNSNTNSNTNVNENNIIENITVKDKKNSEDNTIAE